MINKRSIGKYGEEIAKKYLLDKGYKIVTQNFHIRSSEIDLIVKKDDLYVFIEVKYRKNNNFGTPFEAVSIKKQKSICKAAKSFIGDQDLSVRFDVIGILSSEITHLENAFDYIE